jgi:hypothetical protein
LDEKEAFRICKFQAKLVKVLECLAHWSDQINKAAGLERSLPWTLNFNESPTNSHSWSRWASTSICALGWAVQRLIYLQKEDLRRSYILYTSSRAHQRYRSGINRRVVLSCKHVQVEETSRSHLRYVTGTSSGTRTRENQKTKNKRSTAISNSFHDLRSIRGF